MAYTSPFDIPDDDPEFQAFKTQFLGTGKEQEVGGFSAAAKHAVGSTLRGVGQYAADWVPGVSQANALQRYGKEVQDANPTAIHGFSDFLEHPVTGAKEALGGAVGPMGLAAGATALGTGIGMIPHPAAQVVGRGLQFFGTGAGAMGLFGAPSQSSIYEAQKAADPEFADSVSGKLARTAASLGVGAIEQRFGPQEWAAKAMTKGGREKLAETFAAKSLSGAIGKGVVRGAAVEGAEELAQNPIEQFASLQNPLSPENLKETAFGGFMGAVGGGLMGGAFGGVSRRAPQQAADAETDSSNTPVNLLSPDAPKGTQGDLFGEGGTQGPLMTPGYNDAPADGNPIRDRVVEMMSDRATLDAFVKENYTTNPDAAAQAIALIDRIDNGLRSITQGAPATDTYANFNPNQGSLDLGFAPDTAQEPVNLLAPESTQAPVQDDLVSRWEAALNETQSTQVAQESGQGASGVAGGSAGNTQTQPGVGRGGDTVAATSVLGSGANQLVGNTTGPDGAGVKAPTQPRGKAAINFETKLNHAVETGEIAKDDPLVKDWHAGRKLAKDATEFEQALNDKLAGEPLEPTSPEQRLADEAASERAEQVKSVEDLLATLTPRERQVVDMYHEDKNTLEEIGAILAVLEQRKKKGDDGNPKPYSREAIRVVRNKAIAKMKAGSIKFGLTPEQVDEFFPDESKVMSGGADVKTSSSAEVAQSGSKMTYTDDRATRNTVSEIDGINFGGEDAVGQFDEDGTENKTEGKEASVASELDDEYAGFKLDTAPDGEQITPEMIDQAKAEWDDLDGTELRFRLLAPWVNLVYMKDKGYIDEKEFFRYYGKLSRDNELLRAESYRSIPESSGEQARSGDREQSGVQSKDGESLVEDQQTQDASRAEQTSSAEGSERVKYSIREGGPSNEEIDAFENGMLTLDEFLPERFPSVASREISFPGPGGRITPKAIPGYQFFRETNGEGLFDLLAYDKQYNFNRTFVATKPDIALGQGGNTGINVVFRSKSLSGRENVKPGTGKLAGREYVTEVIAPRAVVEVSMRPAQEKSLRPLVRRVLASEFDRTTDENGKLVFTRKLGYSRKNVAQQSRGVEGSTQAAAIEGKLKPLFFSNSRFSNRVVVVQSAAALPQNLQSAIDGNTQAFVQGGKVYMIADNIAEGKELAVFLHEVGVHLGMKGLIGQENLNRLAMQVKRWAVKNDGSVESEIAKKALARVKSAQQGGVDMELGDVIEERVAYFVEEAVNAGINPTALSKSGGPLQQWFRTLWAAVKTALRKFGLDRVHTLTAQNLVDLSYGAARLELEGTWHGTAADFRNFDHSYMGSGEGAQAFGWGTYLAQRVGIAKGYWEDDVYRKHDRGDVVFPDGTRINQTSILDAGADAAQLLAYDYLENAGKGDFTKAIQMVGDSGFKFRGDAAKVLQAWQAAGGKFERATDKGSLMRVDTAVHEDEMLDWDKPLSEQSEVVKGILKEKLPDIQPGGWGDHGSQLYGWLASNPKWKNGDKAASEYLDSIGIKGIKFLDSQSRDAEQLAANAKRHLARLEESYANASANYEANPSEDNLREKTRVEKLVTTARKQAEFIPTRNLVIFNDKNIQRVVTQVGADRERIKFSKSSNIAQTNPQYRQASTLVRQTLEYLGNKFQSVENNTMFGHQLAQKAEQLMPGTSRYFKSLIQRQTERVKHEQEIARIANRYNELETRDDQNALNAFVQKSTMDGKWGFKPTWFEKDVQTPVDPAMKAEFDKLTPAAQQIAKDMFKFGSEQQKRFDTSVNANITDPKKKVPRNQMYGKPYAPLKRFGDHVVVGKSAEFVAEEKAHPGSKRLEEMKADENHYYVEFTDGNWESIKRRDEMAATNPNMTWGSKPLQLENRALNSVNMTILEKLKNQIEASDNKSTDATKGALKSLANQLYIQQLNQMHANKSQAKRLKVKGAEADMMKAFVSQGRAEAALIANLMTHAESEAGLQQIQTAARTGGNQDAKTRVANAVLRRHLAMLDFQPTPVQNKLMGANSFMMLLTSPAYYLTNATQPFVVSMPYMAGRFGGANSWNTLRDAYKTTLELVKLSTLFKDQNLDSAHLKKFNSVGREAEALQVLLDENLVNVGMEMELGDIASQSKNPAMKNLQKGLQVLKTGVANVEVLNRLSTAVAAYRLAYAEALNKGSSKDAAHEAGTSYARQTIIDTHGDYAGYNAPTVMMQGAFGSMPVKLMTQFKKFQFIQAGLLIGTFRDAYLRGNLNENEKAAAKAMFKWMLGTQAALAGALGGVTGVPMALLGALVAGVFGDDGEDKEAFLRRILGGGAFAQLILHGVPAAAGVDISKRVGMGAALDPFRMADPQTDWSDYALSLAGPSAGLASRTASGLNYIGKGQYWKGLEMLMPSGILTNASKIARYEAEGLTNSRGDVVMKPEEISLMTDLMQGLGLETTQLSDRRWKAGAIYDRGIHFKEKTSQLQRRYVDAFKDGDREELTAIRQEWMKLQAERVNQGFKRENMTALTQAPMAQKKRERETVNGLQTTQTNKQFVASMDAL